MGIWKWEMGNGKCELGNGNWEMGNGKCEMGNGQWEIGNGNVELGNGKWGIEEIKVAGWLGEPWLDGWGNQEKQWAGKTIGKSLLREGGRCRGNRGERRTGPYL